MNVNIPNSKFVCEFSVVDTDSWVVESESTLDVLILVASEGSIVVEDGSVKLVVVVVVGMV